MATWTGLVNCTLVGSVLTKTSGGGPEQNAGANTAESIATNGDITWTMPQNTKWLTVGLGVLSGWTLQESEIAYRWDLGPTGYCVPFAEGQPNWGVEQQYFANDVFRVWRDGSSAKFYRNGLLVWNKTSILPLGTVVGLVGIQDQDGAISGTVMTGTSSGGGGGGGGGGGTIRRRRMLMGVGR